MGMTKKEVFDLSKIDPWFLAQVEDLIISEENIIGVSLKEVDSEAYAPIEAKRILR